MARWTFGLDAAAEADSALVPNYLGPDHADATRRDALAFEHWAELAAPLDVWLNAPYAPTPYLSKFLSRATVTAKHGTRVVGLLPASTGANWWWTHVIEAGARVEFLRGRLAFTGPHARTGSVAPWPSAIVIWEPRTP